MIRNQTFIRLARVISWVVLVLSVAAAMAGILAPSLYLDNAFVRATWMGSDAATLIAAPCFAAALVWVGKGAARAIPAWLGLLDFFLYNFAFYLFGSAFNALFLVYAGVVSLSILGLISALGGIDWQELGRRVRPARGERAVAAFLLLVALGLTVVYASMSLAFVVSGQLPVIVRRSGHPTSVVFALDLTLVVPYFTIAGVLMLRSAPLGYLLAAVMSVKTVAYMAALSLGTIVVDLRGEGSGLAELPLWIAIGIGGALSTAWLTARIEHREPALA
jgi:hypothetical protein